MRRFSQTRPPGHLSISCALLAAVGAAVFVLALDQGTFSVASRTAVGIAVWWTVMVGVLAGLWPLGRLSPPAASVGLLFGAFAAWTGTSMAWADDREAAFLELTRVLLYLGIFALVVLASRRDLVRWWSDGVALGIVGVAAIALVSRFFPDLVDPGILPRIVAAARSRLSYPLGYWNGLAILVGLAIPLLLGVAVRSRAFFGRAAGVAPVPAIAAVVYLASSRGGALVAAVGSLAFLALARRWSALIAIAIGGAGSVAAVTLVLERRTELVEEPLTEAARGQGPEAAALLLALCIATGLVYAGVRLIPIRSRPPAWMGWGAAALAVAVGALIVASLDPVSRFEAFKRPAAGSPPTVRGHFLSGGGTGRWQQWNAAVDQFQAHPVQGGGAGSYGAWWLEHGDNPGFVTEAHSLYLETLGELGIVGLVFLAAVFLTAVVAAVRHTTRGDPEEQITGAAVAAVLLAFLVGAGIDWMWELTIVSVVGITAAGLGVVSSGGSDAVPHTAWARGGAAVVAAAVGLVALGSQGIALLADEQLRASQLAAREGDLSRAAEAAVRAKAIQPWSASAHLQLALLHEEAGRLEAARRWIGRTRDLNPRDWQAWLVAARIETKLGRIEAARRSLAMARKLNPDTAIFDNG